MEESITIRAATADDIPDLVALRRLMFESMEYRDPELLDASDIACRNYFSRAIPSGEFCGWLATTSEGEAVASGGLVIDRHPPGPNNLAGEVGYVMNIVTVPAYRRQGLARRIMQTIVDWLSAQGIRRITLHATEQGRPLYRELGFDDSNEMILTLS